MSHITVIDHTNANAEQKALLDAIQNQMGMVPNFLRVFANSPTALKAFLGLQGVADGGSLSMQTRERIALTLAQQNLCEYSLSAHAVTGRQAGLTGNEMASNRELTSEDARAAVASETGALIALSSARDQRAAAQSPGLRRRAPSAQHGGLRGASSAPAAQQARTRSAQS